jgi:hypothetical protein
MRDELGLAAQWPALVSSHENPKSRLESRSPDNVSSVF